MNSSDHTIDKGRYYMYLGKEPAILVCIVTDISLGSPEQSTQEAMCILRSLPLIEKLWTCNDETEREYFDSLNYLVRTQNVYLWTGRRWSPVRSGRASYFVLSHWAGRYRNERERFRSKRSWRAFLRSYEDFPVLPASVGSSLTQ
jgi:hypothetical protein